MASGSPGRAVLALVNVALTVVNAAKALVSAFTGEWDNAAFKLQELGGHHLQAECYLQVLEQNLSEKGRRYPNYGLLQRTLQDYREFLDEYKPLLAIEIDKPQGRWQRLRFHTKSLENTKTTAQWVLSVQKAVELKQRIITCTEGVNHFDNTISK
jgi:tetratricopeptide (TPR) repeat protein